MIKAVWRPGMESFHIGVDAQRVADEIMAIGDSATPKQIVDKARDESGELHKCFEWDDSKAAEMYREDQARALVRHLVIQDDSPREDKPVRRFFYNITRGEGYKPTELIVKNPDEYEKLLAQAQRELQAFKRKYSSLVELQELFEMIDKIA